MADPEQLLAPCFRPPALSSDVSLTGAFQLIGQNEDM
jgi:hypothetical protein